MPFWKQSVPLSLEALLGWQRIFGGNPHLVSCIGTEPKQVGKLRPLGQDLAALQNRSSLIRGKMLNATRNPLKGLSVHISVCVAANILQYLKHSICHLFTFVHVMLLNVVLGNIPSQSQNTEQPFCGQWLHGSPILQRWTFGQRSCWDGWRSWDGWGSLCLGSLTKIFHRSEAAAVTHHTKISPIVHRDGYGLCKQKQLLPLRAHHPVHDLNHLGQTLFTARLGYKHWSDSETCDEKMTRPESISQGTFPGNTACPTGCKVLRLIVLLRIVEGNRIQAGIPST